MSNISKASKEVQERKQLTKWNSYNRESPEEGDLMIILSLNVRGVGGAQKLQALGRLFFVYHLDVVPIQETISLGSKAIGILSSLLKNWNFCSIDAEDLSGGWLALMIFL